MSKNKDANEPPSTLGDRIKLIIREKELKQVNFAKALGISANYVYLLTSGKKKTISEPLAKLIESTYGYPAAWVLKGESLYVTGTSPSDLKTDIIRKIKRMSYNDLKAVSSFIRSLTGL